MFGHALSRCQTLLGPSLIRVEKSRFHSSRLSPQTDRVPFALLQSRLEIPNVDALRRAFRGVGGLAPADAPTIARDGFGILLRQLTEEDAGALQSSLAREGVATEIVDERALPAVPPSKLMRRVVYRLDAFVGYDPYDRELVIPWDRVALAAVGQMAGAGAGWRSESSLDGTTQTEVLLLENLLRTGTFEVEERQPKMVRPKSEIESGIWVADFILVGGEIRFTLQAHQLAIVGLGERDMEDPLTNFFTFVRDSLWQLPSALLNRAAYALREELLDRLLDGHADCPRYPTRNAYHEELIWLLWRLRQSGRPV